MSRVRVRSLVPPLDPHAKILIARQIKPDSRPTRRETVQILIGLLTFGLALAAAYTAFRLPDLFDPVSQAILIQISSWLGTATYYLLMLMPLLAAITSTLWADIERRREAYDLLSITPLTLHALYQGLFFSTIYRLRVTFAAAVMLIPVYTVWLTDLTLILNSDALTGITRLQIVMCGGIFSLSGVGLLGVAILGIVGGTTIAMRRLPLAAGLLLALLATAGFLMLHFLSLFVLMVLCAGLGDVFLCFYPFALLVLLIVSAGPFVWARMTL